MKTKETDNGLKRKLGLFPVTNIVVANMVGAGIFTTSGLLMNDLLNPVLMIALWMVGGVIALCGALSYGELGAAMPRAGGEYLYLSRLYHPAFGFLSGWMSLFAGFSAPIAASAIGFTEYLTRAFPELLGAGEHTVMIKKLLAMSVIAVFTVIHMRGIEVGAKVQNYLTVLKVALIVGLVVFGFSIGSGNTAHFSQGASFTFNLSGWKTIGLSLMWIMFAYSGWNASAYIGSEIKNPAKNLPRSLFLGTGIVMLLYLAINLFYVYAVSPDAMKGVISIGGLAAGNLFGKGFENVLSLLISFALFSSLSAYVILGPRVYYSMASDGYFFKFASNVHPRYGVPSQSVLLQGILAAAMVMLGTFDQVLTYLGFSLGVFPIFAVIGVFKLRRSGKLPYRMPGYPVVPVFYVLVSVAILILGFSVRPVESSIAILTLLTGIPVFFIFKKRGASHKSHP